MTDQVCMRVAQGEFELRRNPADNDLRAWDAADEFLLGYIDETDLLKHGTRVLILNDSFGSLAVALADYRPYSWSDSCLAQQGLRDNLALNGLPADCIDTNRSICFPAAYVDCVLLKVPKTLALLEHQLYQLQPLLHRSSRIIAAGMSRNIHRSTLSLFETILGPTTTTRARKKSRLILVDRDTSIRGGKSPFPQYYDLVVDREYRISNQPGLFSGDRLDPGSRFMLEQLPVSGSYRKIVDLGCGSGVLGIVAASYNPQAQLTFVDESHMAVASARDNFRAVFAQTRIARYQAQDCAADIDLASQDLVLCNPPFHQQHNMGDSIAWKMFKDARRILTDGGELWIVGNRQLGYHAKLKKIFGDCRVIDSNRKYVLLRAIK